MVQLYFEKHCNPWRYMPEVYKRFNFDKNIYILQYDLAVLCLPVFTGISLTPLSYYLQLYVVSFCYR
jgi:hypothetical protein